MKRETYMRMNQLKTIILAWLESAGMLFLRIHNSCCNRQQVRAGRFLEYSSRQVDVLNTTARILSKCGEFNEEIIASADVLSGIPSLKDYITKPLGAIKLKGKEKEVMLNALALAA